MSETETENTENTKPLRQGDVLDHSSDNALETLPWPDYGRSLSVDIDVYKV